MIVAKLSGGLGNQLFQYAFARAVSSRQKTDFKLDTAPFDTYYKLHKYSLQHFNIKENLASGSDLGGFVWLRAQNRFFDAFYRYLRLKRFFLPFYYPERTFAYDPDVFMKRTAYFDGFWQTERYFKEIESDIRKEITLKTPLSKYSSDILNQIKGKNTVSLHIRRGDYVSNASTAAFHGVCSMEYYQAAIAFMADKIKNPHFFIFSDDYAWAVENFKTLPYPTTCVSNTAEKNYEDLILMSSCQHHIIANSSFSWWGAWLDPKKDKIVIAPKKWFAGADKNDTKDLVPTEWIRF